MSGRPAHNRIEPPEDVAVAHAAGESVLAIATRLSVSRGVIVRWLRDAGVEPRTPKEAGLLRVVLTDAERVEKRRALIRNYRARKRGTKVPDHLEHGSAAAIATYDCRCDICRAAKRKYDKRRRVEKADQLSQQRRARYQANLEGSRARGREHYRRNAAVIKARVKEYQGTERGRLVKRATGDRRRGVPLTPQGREFAAIVINDPCSYCAERGGTVDHIVAVAAGGDGDWTNLAGACASCNSRKRDLPLLQFLLRLQSTEMIASH